MLAADGARKVVVSTALVASVQQLLTLRPEKMRIAAGLVQLLGNREVRTSHGVVRVQPQYRFEMRFCKTWF